MRAFLLPLALPAPCATPAQSAPPPGTGLHCAAAAAGATP